MRDKIINKILRKFGYSLSEANEFKFESYSQCGEDSIVKFIFQQLKISNPIYLDLGAHHPHFLNNTFIFYKNGSRGVNVEPDPILIKEFLRLRPHDINLNAGVGFKKNEETADFYLMTNRVLNTFSKTEALKIESYGSCRIEKVLQIPLIPIRSILNYFKNDYPNYITLDVEGLDLEIIQTFDFIKYRPEVFCIETITYVEDKSERKMTEIIEFMLGKGYFVFADTFINTIFVDKKAWSDR